MKKTTNAIIILNYNDSETVVSYLNLIKDYKSINKILVVDNMSTDGSFDILKSCESDKIEVIQTRKNKGYAYGNNYGLKHLERKGEVYDYITISNSDIFINDKAIKNCIDFLKKHENVAICAPLMHDRYNRVSPRTAWKERKLVSDVRDSSKLLFIGRKHVELYKSDYFTGEYSYVDCIPGSFFVARYDVFKYVNYFDDNTFLYYEEDILGKKFKDLGYKEAILNNINYIHFDASSINKSFNSMDKFKKMQKSKKYYHKNYNEECQGIRRLNLLRIDIATLIGMLEIKIRTKRKNKKKTK